MNRLIRRVLPAGLAVLLALGTAPTAHAGGPDEFVVHGTGKPSPAMPKEDLQGIALSTGLTEREVVAAYGEQTAFNAALTTIRTREQKTYFSAGWERGPGYDAWVGFTAPPSDETIADLQALAIDVEV